MRKLRKWLIELRREYLNGMFSSEAGGDYIKALQYQNWIILLNIIIEKTK